MQNDLQDIDLMIRSQMQDAEVKAPRRVWRSVRSRLDEDAALSALGSSASSATDRRWVYVATGLAFAAALATGVFFVGTNGRLETAPDASSVVAQQFGGAEDTLEDGTLQEIPEAEDGHVTNRRPSVSGKKEAIHIVESESAPSGSDVRTAYQEESAGQDHSAKRSASAKEEENNSAAWARIVSEGDDEPARRRPVLYAQGALSGNDSDMGSVRIGRMAPSSTSQTDIGITESSSSVYGVPFSIGVGARFYLTDRFSLGAGIDYSVLTRTFSGIWSPDGDTFYRGDISGRMRYIGIPVNAYYDVFRTGKSEDSSLKFYVFGGGAAEYCISNSYTILASPDATVVKEPVKGLQWSVGGGIGVEFRIAEHLGIYLDPGFRYYFSSGQPKSIRTDKPLMVNVEAGLRFNL